MIKLVLRLCASALWVTVVCSTATALAQESPPPQANDQTATAPPPSSPPRAAPPSAVEEVLVSARRVTEDIQESPVAVTHVSADELEVMHPHDLADLNHIAPNFNIQGSAALFRNSAIAFARGIGYNNIDGTLDPGLGISVDGVFYLRNVGVLQNMFDLQSVEIVLGPQGTLFGKNTVAGVLNVTTQKPKLGEWELTGRLRYGNYDREDTEFVGNVPLGDNLALRFAYQSQYSDGPYKNVYADPVTNLVSADHRLGGDDTNTYRTSLLWSPTDRVDVTAIATALRNRSPSVGGTNMAKPGSLAALSLGHPGFGQPGGLNDRYKVERIWPSGDYFDMNSITIDARYHADSFDVISVSNYTHDSNPRNYDDFTYANLLNNYAEVDHEQWSQEVRVQSTGDGPLSWVVGAFYDDGYYDYWQSFYNNIPVLFGAPTPTINNQWIFQWSNSLSGFGQVDYWLTDKLQLTAGMRVMTEEKKAKNYAGFVGPTTRNRADWPLENIVKDDKEWDKTTYRLGAKYLFTDDLMAYVSYATGFHSGGFNSAAQAGVGIPPEVTRATLGPWDPEEAESYEAGVRSEWFDRRLQFNLTGFWTYYDNLQSFNSFVVNPNTGLSAVGPANGGKSRARGIEIQAVAVPMTGLTFVAAIGFLDVEFTEFDTIRNGLPFDCEENCDPVRSPDRTARFTSSYDIFTDIGRFTPTITYNYTSSFYTDTFNDPVGHVNSYGTVDAALVYTDPTERWSVSAWGRNLTDEAYVTGFLNDASGAFPVPIFTTRYYGDPRTYGVELRFRLEG